MIERAELQVSERYLIHALTHIGTRKPWPDTAPLPSRVNTNRIRQNARRFWMVNLIRRSEVEAQMYHKWPKMARCKSCGTLLPVRDACHYCVA